MPAAPDPAEPVDVERLAQRLAAQLARLSAESRFHLETALTAAETPGIQGTLLVQFPRRPAENALVKWVGGTRELQLPI